MSQMPLIGQFNVQNVEQGQHDIAIETDIEKVEFLEAFYWLLLYVKCAEMSHITMHHSQGDSQSALALQRLFRRGFESRHRLPSLMQGLKA
ncbi:hypothetical protein PoB_004727400 [Plakobranchus ocellatus]|uniref:Uncharacterized protein n=1 Tax=Plakobranchus ocellatus TaxID=259542 RepID=A0AAV4BPJ5_9GAST|nr:hypothetical protein PoB_004727400 [Plakobranchus ocellatus]